VSIDWTYSIMQHPTQPQQPQTNHRVLSIDALRGFDMFWIMGADTLAPKLLAMLPATVAGVSTAWATGLADPFEHLQFQ